MQGVVGATIRKARTDLGLSQAAFARALGFSSEFISLLEADKRAPSLATLNKIAAYLKKNLCGFLPLNDPKAWRPSVRRQPGAYACGRLPDARTC